MAMKMENVKLKFYRQTQKYLDYHPNLQPEPEPEPKKQKL
jgi:hypothetical protein